MKYSIKTSETEDTIHGYMYHVGGLRTEVQLCDMGWWRVHKGDEVIHVRHGGSQGVTTNRAGRSNSMVDWNHNCKEHQGVTL